MAKGPPKGRGADLVGVFFWRQEMKRLLDLARDMAVNPRRQVLRLEMVPSLDQQRDTLFAELGPHGLRRELAAELEPDARAWKARLEGMLSQWQQMSPEDYEEFSLDEGLADLGNLRMTTEIELLLHELAEGRELTSAATTVADGDVILWQYGKVLYGPLIRNGQLRDLRESWFEPRERWWFYLDELDSMEVTRVE